MLFIYTLFCVQSEFIVQGLPLYPPIINKIDSDWKVCVCECVCVCMHTQCAHTGGDAFPWLRACMSFIELVLSTSQSLLTVSLTHSLIRAFTLSHSRCHSVTLSDCSLWTLWVFWTTLSYSHSRRCVFGKKKSLQIKQWRTRHACFGAWLLSLMPLCVHIYEHTHTHTRTRTRTHTHTHTHTRTWWWLLLLL